MEGPAGEIEAYKIAREEVDCRLILLGSAATDNPEGAQVHNSLLDQVDDRIMLINLDDSLPVNALQRYSAVVLQKSLREGFGLTVTEAMWKGQPVIGGNVGGIRYQIQDGYNGFVVNSVQEAGDRIVQLLKDPNLRRTVGERVRETVREKFLMTRLLEQYLDLFSSSEMVVRVRDNPSLVKAPPGRAAVAATAGQPAGPGNVWLYDLSLALYRHPRSAQRYACAAGSMACADPLHIRFPPARLASYISRSAVATSVSSG